MESEMDRHLYRLRNWHSEIHMALVRFGAALGHALGVLSAYGTLSAKVMKADGSVVDLGAVGMRVVTNTGVAMLVDYWDAGTPAFTNMNYHDSGTGTVAEAAADTGLGTAAGPTTRATGTKSQPSANVLRSVATISYTATLAITEHGLFDSATRGAENAMWDRTVFAAINVVSGDSIQFTYDCTLTAGG